LEFLAHTGTAQGLLYAAGGALGSAAAGALRGAQLLLGVLNVPRMGTLPIVQVVAIRRAATSGSQMYRMVRNYTAATIVLTLAYGTILLATPDSIGRNLLGDSWTSTKPLLLPMTLVMAAQCAAAGAVVGFRAFEAIRLSMSVRIHVSILLILGTGIGLATGDLELTAFGMAVGGLIGGGWAWLRLRTYTRGHEVRTPSVGAHVPSSAAKGVHLEGITEDG
jgi:hypothetical protein